MSDWGLIAQTEPIGEVVPAREGLRRQVSPSIVPVPPIGEVVPAREGLRPLIRFSDLFSIMNRRSGSSKRRIKTMFGINFC